MIRDPGAGNELVPGDDDVVRDMQADAGSTSWRRGVVFRTSTVLPAGTWTPWFEGLAVFGEGAADAGARSGDHGHLAVESPHAVCPTFVVVVDRAGSRGATTYCSTSNLRVSRRNVKVVRGQRVTLRPWESRYQLEQPPEFHTVRSSSGSRSAL